MNHKTTLAGSLVALLALSAVLTAQPVAHRKGERDASAQPGTLVVPSPAYGTVLYSVTSVFAASFNGVGILDPIATDGVGYRYFTGGSGLLIGSVSIPSGVVIDFIGLNSCDPAGSSFDLTLYDATVGSDYTAVGSMVSSLNPCAVQYNGTALNYLYAQTAGHNLQIYIHQDPSTPQDGTAGVMSAEVWWRRQVSTPPADPDFLDVATSNPQYQFIEALFKSGITVGCGGGNFCPNAPVTRGQMAVYLAKALGLAWQF